MKQLKNKVALLVLAFSLILTSATAAIAASTDTAGQVLNGLKNTGGEAGFSLNGNAPSKDFVTAFLGFANALTILLSTVFVLLVIYSGFLWMTAHGNEQQVDKSKNIILGAAIGIIVVISARAIAQIALYVLTNTLTPGAGS